VNLGACRNPNVTGQFRWTGYSKLIFRYESESRSLSSALSRLIFSRRVGRQKSACTILIAPNVIEIAKKKLKKQKVI